MYIYIYIYMYIYIYVQNYKKLVYVCIKLETLYFLKANFRSLHKFFIFHS